MTTTSVVKVMKTCWTCSLFTHAHAKGLCTGLTATMGMPMQNTGFTQSPSMLASHVRRLRFDQIMAAREGLFSVPSAHSAFSKLSAEHTKSNQSLGSPEKPRYLVRKACHESEAMSGHEMKVTVSQIQETTQGRDNYDDRSCSDWLGRRLLTSKHNLQSELGHTYPDDPYP